jgi:hypothetical protein
MTPKERDAMARKLGYRSFDEYKAKQERYRPGKSKIPEQKQPRNVMEKIPIHPAGILRRVADKFNAATGNSE